MSVQHYTKGTTTTTTTSWKECHEGNILVFTTHDGIEVHAGGSSRKGGWWLMEKPPDLAMGPDNEVLKGMASKLATRGLDEKAWPCMNKVYIIEPPKNILAIDFPDFKVPQDLGKDFWMELVGNIRKNEVKSIHCMCMGGHGRTGVQLAILRYYLATEKERTDWKDAGDVIKAIRGPYCDKAVESIAQQEYVAKMCGIDEGQMVEFHKTQYGTQSYYKSGVKRTNFNIKLVECSVCNFITWENDSHDLLKGEWCHDLKCQGKLIDVNEFCIKRDTANIEKDSCMCLNCLQPISDIQIMSVTHLSGDTMEMLHGGEWSKLLSSQLKLHGNTMLKGRLLRNLAETLIDEKAPTDLIVADSCILCDFNMKDNSDAPDYEKGDKGFVHHVKCDYCYKNLSPHLLTMAINVKTNTYHKACPECINDSKAHFYFSDNLVKEDGVLIDGVSPQRWLRLTHIDAFKPKDGKDEDTLQEDIDAKPASVADGATMNKSTKGDYDDYGMW